jgi:hypothetical protein
MSVASHSCRLKGKLKRTKPFYKEQFEYLKSIVSAEVCSKLIHVAVHAGPSCLSRNCRV